MVVCYATIVVVLGIIPFFGEASLLGMFKSLDKNNVDKLCKTFNELPITYSSKLLNNSTIQI